jgi:hypothetical protein
MHRFAHDRTPAILPAVSSWRAAPGRATAAPSAQLRRVIDQLDADDVLMVTRLDRLA